ncbi:MAG: carbohydrate-binding protein [Tannerellaceae bacterium]|jgi:hypothetical protein|nr:carbohydrate-binding protein [Tannerellaceae bacterium]
MKRHILTIKAILFLLAGWLMGCENAKEQSLFSFNKALYINKATLTLYKGEEIQLLVSPEENMTHVIWTSNNENIVTVANGLVKALETGFTDIIAIFGDERRMIPVTITLPEIDKVVARGGDGRLTLDIYINNDKINKVKAIDDVTGIETNMDISFEKGVFHLPFTGLSENDYTFTVYGYDAYGNQSPAIKASCKVTGDIYKTTLANRPLKIATQWGNCCVITWTNVTGNFIDLYYTNETGKEVSRRVEADLSHAILDFKKGSTLSYRTVFLPDEAALDTFYMPIISGIAITNKSYTLTAATPCEIFARDFDYGGEGIGFHDTNTSNTARSYRKDLGDDGSEAVRIDDATHLNIGSANAGDWFAYTIEVKDEGDYQVDVQYGTTGVTGIYSIEAGERKSAEIPLNKATGGWQTYIWCNVFLNIEKPPVFHFEAGKHRIKFINVATNYNFKSLKFTYISP